MSDHRKRLWTDARRRALKKGLPFSIHHTDIIIPRYCPILGLELEIQKGQAGANSPTLDRMDNTKGYVEDNVWVISMLANAMKSFASVTDLQKFARWVHQKYGQLA